MNNAIETAAVIIGTSLMYSLSIVATADNRANAKMNAVNTDLGIMATDLLDYFMCNPASVLPDREVIGFLFAGLYE